MSRRHKSGFTLIELLVVVVIIGILAAVALPNFIGAQKKAKNASVKANMHEFQIAAESYATDAGGVYGVMAGGVDSYLPGGSNTLSAPAAGHYPNNPFTAAAQTAKAATTANEAAISANRLAHGVAAAEGVGFAGYSPFNSGASGSNGANDTYAIDGGDDTAHLVLGVTGSLVLSNQ